MNVLQQQNIAPIDIACIGGGPANLSLASLAQERTNLTTEVFEKNKSVTWHPYAMFSESNLQTSFLEDLVTPVDPTHPSSFLNFLAAKGRMTQFLCASEVEVSRLEFEQYFQWASERLRNLHVNSPVQRVTLDGSFFRVETEDRVVKARNLSLGVGVEPHLPDWAKPHVGDSIFHAWSLLEKNPDLTGKTVVVVGGGQTSAEVINTLLDDNFGTPKRVVWLSRRANLVPMDDTPFVNEFFTLQYAQHYNTLDEGTRNKLASAHRLYCDGVSPGMAGALYNKIYFRQHVAPIDQGFEILLNESVKSLSRNGNSYLIETVSNADGNIASIETDTVIMATGCERPIPACLDELSAEFFLTSNGELDLGPNYEVKWKNAHSPSVYTHNRGRVSHGLGDNTFCMVSWRSATILNDILGTERFATAPDRTAINWAYGRS